MFSEIGEADQANDQNDNAKDHKKITGLSSALGDQEQHKAANDHR